MLWKCSIIIGDADCCLVITHQLSRQIFGLHLSNTAQEILFILYHISGWPMLGSSSFASSYNIMAAIHLTHLDRATSYVCCCVAWGSGT